MSEGGTPQNGGQSGTFLELELWHPDCWTLHTTRSTDAGLVARGLYTVDNEVHARFTAHGETDAAVNQLVAAAHESSLTSSVRELEPHLDPLSAARPPGRATRELLVEYSGENSVYEPLISQGFVPDGTVEITDGQEYWPVVINADRDGIKRRLDAVRAEMDADVEICRIGSTGSQSSDDSDADALTPRQRQALRTAIDAGYYEWPRDVTAGDLAAALNVSKPTLLEHLRKAEAKVLNTFADDSA